MDIKKDFESLNHSFILVVLTKFDFGKTFISWIEAILEKSESSVINNGKTPPHFQLNREALEVLVMEDLFTLIKSKSLIQRLEILKMSLEISIFSLC